MELQGENEQATRQLVERWARPHNRADHPRERLHNIADRLNGGLR